LPDGLALAARPTWAAAIPLLGWISLLDALDATSRPAATHPETFFGN
jgi:hypothetical protein